MKNEPKRIYIQVGEDCPKDADFNELHEVTHSTERINNNDLEYYSKTEVNEGVNEGVREMFDKFYEWLDGLTQAEYDDMSLTDKCEKYFFEIYKQKELEK